MQLQNDLALYPEVITSGVIWIDKLQVGNIIDAQDYLGNWHPAIVIDELIQELTTEYNTTTIVVTHDMNSVMGIGDNIIFLHGGQKWWEGTNKEISSTDNKELNEFVFASKFMRTLQKK